VRFKFPTRWHLFSNSPISPYDKTRGEEKLDKSKDTEKSQSTPKSTTERIGPTGSFTPPG